MIERIKNAWHKFVASFHSSEVIIWARIQYIFGLLLVAVQSTDLSVFINDQRLLQCYIFANALLTEMLRRRREDFGSEDK